MTERKYGKLVPQPQGGALQYGGNPENLERGKRRKAAQDRRIEGDPNAPLVEIAKDLTELTKKIVARARGKGVAPDRETMDIIREFRLTQAAIAEVRRQSDATEQVKEFFTQIPARVASAAQLLPDGLKLPVELPADLSA